MKLNILTIFLFLINFNCNSQQASISDKKYSPQLLKNDLRQLQNALMEFHPGPTRHVPIEKIREGFKKADKLLTAGMTNWEFYYLIAPLVASLQCGHTRLYPSSSMQDQLNKRLIYFPLPLIVRGDHAYVKLDDNSIAEVFEINEQPMARIIKIIYSSFAVDGNAVDAKQDFIQPFADYYARYINSNPKQFILRIKKENKADLEQVVLSPKNKEEITRDLSGPPIQFTIINDVAHLKVKTFSSDAYKKSNIDYSDFLKKTFSELRNKNISRLIVDVRGNGGGDDEYGAKLFSYLAERSFGYFKNVYKKNGDGFSKVNHPCLERQQPNPLAFKGKICLLINGKTFSTAADVASVFKSNKRGTIIGRETGGGYDGNTSGASKRVTLTNSKITIQIPLWYYENDVEKPKEAHRGVIPDLKTNPPYAEILLMKTDSDIGLANEIFKDSQ